MVETSFRFDLDQYVTVENAQKIIDTFPSGNGLFAKYVHSILNEGHTLILAFDIADISIVGKNRAESRVRDHIFKTLAEIPKQKEIGPETTGSILKDTINESAKDIGGTLAKGFDALGDIKKNLVMIAIVGAVIIGGVIAFKVTR